MINGVLQHKVLNNWYSCWMEKFSI